jgi:hypothetical protein
VVIISGYCILLHYLCLLSTLQSFYMGNQLCCSNQPSVRPMRFSEQAVLVCGMICGKDDHKQATYSECSSLPDRVRLAVTIGGQRITCHAERKVNH